MLRSVIRGLSGLYVQSAVPALSVAPSSIRAEAAFVTPLTQQVRTTFVLRRKWKPRLVKQHEKYRAKRLKVKNYVYELVEDTNVKPDELIKVILLAPVEGLGGRGDVLEVKPHRARNKLILPGLAVYASPENLKKYDHLKSEELSEDAPSSPFSQKTCEAISLRVISLSMNMENPWVVEPWHVRVALRRAGITVHEEALTLPEQPIKGPNMELESKEFLVKVKVNNKESCNVRCRIHHVATNLRDRIPWQANHWLYVADPIFPEQAEALTALTHLNRNTIYPQEELD